jgi:hypothetical protein
MDHQIALGKIDLVISLMSKNKVPSNPKNSFIAPSDKHKNGWET